MKTPKHFTNPNGKPRCQFTVGCVTMGISAIGAAIKMNSDLNLDLRWSPSLRKAAKVLLKEMAKYQKESEALSEAENPT